MVIATNSVRSLSPLFAERGWGEGQPRGFEPLTLTIMAAVATPPDESAGAQPRGGTFMLPLSPAMMLR